MLKRKLVPREVLADVVVVVILATITMDTKNRLLAWHAKACTVTRAETCTAHFPIQRNN